MKMTKTYRLCGYTLTDAQLDSICYADYDYIEDLANTRDIDRKSLELSEDWVEYNLTNEIIYRILDEIIDYEVEDEVDREKLHNSIYTNCLDSWYDINENQLRTEQARKFINNF